MGKGIPTVFYDENGEVFLPKSKEDLALNANPISTNYMNYNTSTSRGGSSSSLSNSSSSYSTSKTTSTPKPSGINTDTDSRFTTNKTITKSNPGYPTTTSDYKSTTKPRPSGIDTNTDSRFTTTTQSTPGYRSSSVYEVASYDEVEAKSEKVAAVYNEFCYDDESGGGILECFEEIRKKLNDISEDIREVTTSYKKLEDMYDMFTNFDSVMEDIIAQMHSSHTNMRIQFDNMLRFAQRTVLEVTRSDEQYMNQLHNINDYFNKIDNDDSQNSGHYSSPQNKPGVNYNYDSNSYSTNMRRQQIRDAASKYVDQHTSGGGRMSSELYNYKEKKLDEFANTVDPTSTFAYDIIKWSNEHTGEAPEPGDNEP